MPVLELPKLTDEQKKRFGPAIRRTIQALGEEIEPTAELVLDADRPMCLGGMSAEDQKEMLATADVDAWVELLI